jgi:hypothetical protein
MIEHDGYDSTADTLRHSLRVGELMGHPIRELVDRSTQHDRVRAHELARNTGQMVVELTAHADYRSPDDRRFDEKGWARP